MIGAELNAAIEEEWPAPETHAKRFRFWLGEKATESLESLNGSAPPETQRNTPAGAPTSGEATTS